MGYYWDIIGIFFGILPSGELTKSYGKSPFLMGKWDIIGILLGYYWDIFWDITLW